jgi:hypothetical protein
VRLWDEELALADAQERALWHEAMPRALFDSAPMQEKRWAGAEARDGAGPGPGRRGGVVCAGAAATARAAACDQATAPAVP